LHIPSVGNPCRPSADLLRDLFCNSSVLNFGILHSGVRGQGIVDSFAKTEPFSCGRSTVYIQGSGFCWQPFHGPGFLFPKNPSVFHDSLMARGEVPRGKETLIRIVRGDVDPQDAAYNCWRSALRKLCAEHLDVSILDLWEQAPNVAHIRTIMEKGWTYLGGRLEARNLHRRIVAIQKYRRRSLCSGWEQNGFDSIGRRPPHIPANQWSGLMRYWASGQYAEERAKAARLHSRNGEKDRFPDRGMGLEKPPTLTPATQKTPGAETTTAQAKGLGPTVSTRKV
jgi:hypothetical protein